MQLIPKIVLQQLDTHATQINRVSLVLQLLRSDVNARHQFLQTIVELFKFCK